MKLGCPTAPARLATPFYQGSPPALAYEVLIDVGGCERARLSDPCGLRELGVAVMGEPLF